MLIAMHLKNIAPSTLQDKNRQTLKAELRRATKATLAVACRALGIEAGPEPTTTRETRAANIETRIDDLVKDAKGA